MFPSKDEIEIVVSDTADALADAGRTVQTVTLLQPYACNDTM